MAQNPNCPPFDSGQAISTLQKDLLNRYNIPKASLWMGNTQKTLLLKNFGSHQTGTVYPIFSASKMITASTLMVLVHQGLLRLDDPVDKYLPYFKTKVGKATIRQLLTHSSGLPNSHWSLYVQTTTLDRSVREIAKLKALYVPGTAFLYGSVSYQVAARIAEVVTKKPWNTLVRQYLLSPLGMSRTDYQAFGKTANPIVAIAGRSNAEDYGHLLQMLLAEGLFGSKRILGVKNVQEMRRVQNKGMKILKLPFKGLGPYGIGLWLDRQSSKGKTLQANHYGAFGFCPWMDFERGICGVLALTRSLRDVYPAIEAFRAKVDQGYLPQGVHCFGKSSPWCKGNPSFLLPQRPLSTISDFSLGLEGLPPNLPGWVFLGFKANKTGLDLLGTKFFLGAPVPFFISGFSDAQGALRIVLPWKAPKVGIRFFAQSLWFNPPTCKGGLFSASAAIEVQIL